jgi:hypothetical protein
MTQDELLPSIEKALNLGPDDFDIYVLSDISSEIERAISNGRIDELYQAIKLLPHRRLSAEVLVLLLRVMSPARHAIGELNWRQLVQDVQRCLDDRGLDGSHVLRGLIAEGKDGTGQI